MTRQLCIIHANCQGDALKQLLEATPAFASKFEIRHLRNYERKQLDQGLLDASTLFLHQYLAPKWSEISSEQLLARLPASSQAICIPNCLFKGYWPLWIDKPDVIQFADSLIEDLLERGLEDLALLRLYLKADAALTGDVESMAQGSLQWERGKEARTPIKYVDLIEERWREEQLFLTINHPAPPLLVHIANEILKALGLGQVPLAFAKAYASPLNEFWQPIHPVLGARLGLPFSGAERRYPCFGADLTHEQYTRIYLACRRNGIADLPSALAVHAKRINGGSPAQQSAPPPNAQTAR